MKFPWSKEKQPLGLFQTVRTRIAEQFKGEVQDQKVRFPEELGVEHPFDAKITESLYKKFGIITGVVDKYVDFVVGPGFFVTSEDKRAEKIIQDFIRDVDFDVVLRAWLKEALVKFSGFLEIGGKADEVPQGLKVLDAKTMYVQRDDKGNTEKYNQFVGDLKNFAKKKVIPFEPFQIAQLNLNTLGDEAYGLGLIYPTVQTVDNLISLESSMITLMERKANAPIHFKVGDGDHLPTQDELESIGTKLETLQDKTEFATDGLTNAEVIDFGNFGDKFEKPLQFELESLFFAYQVPEVIMGKGSIPEGLAKVQLDVFDRRIKSIQSEAEKVIENKIFKRVLQANGMDSHVEFEWGEPSKSEQNNKIQQINELLKLPDLNPTLRAELELQLAALMGVSPQNVEDDQAQREKEEAQPQPIVPGQNREELPQPDKIIHEHNNNCVCENHTIEKKNYELKEWLGFNFEDYLDDILNIVEKDEFMLLKAKTDKEIKAGKFSESKITRLKLVLKDAFEKGKSINEITDDIEEFVDPPDLLKTDEEGEIVEKDGNPVVQVQSARRSNLIARSETTRLAAEGAKANYIENDIQLYQWVAAIGDRTCEQCMALNGKVFELGTSPFLPPQHANCRCTIVPVIPGAR